MRLRWQNLKHERPVDLLHGRAWLNFDREYRRVFSVSWRLGRWSELRLMLTIGGEESDFQLGIGLGFVSLYLGIAGFFPYRALPRNVFGRETGFYLVEDSLVLKLHNDDSSWSSISGDAAGWSKSWHLLDVLLGRQEYTEGEKSRVYWIEVEMPEGFYPGTAFVRTDTWKRPRWPWPKRETRCHIEVTDGVPVPGKGENSWDCGEDKDYASCTPAETISEGLAKFTRYIEARRERYGGRNWRPAEKTGT